MVARVASGARGCPAAYGYRNRYPRAKGPSRVLYNLMKYVLLGPLLRLFFPCKVIGSEFIPADGGAILAGNHVSVADSFFTPLHIKRRVTYLAKSEYFTEKGVKGALKKAFFSGMGQVPVDRSGASAARAALDTGIRLLNEGHILGIYPEGTRSPDGRLYKGKTGVARMALEAGVPVVPAALTGLGERTLVRFPASVVKPFFDHPDFQQGAEICYYRRLTVRIGRPIDLSAFEGEEVTGEPINNISGKVRRVVSKLYDGEDLDRFLTGEVPFDISRERV